MNIKYITDKIPDFLLAQLITFSLVYALSSSLGLTYPLINTLLLSMLCVFIIFILFLNKKTSIAAFFIIGAAALASIIYAMFFVGNTKTVSFLRDYFYWLDEYIQYPDGSEPLFQFITVLALCLLLAVFSEIFIVKRFKFLIILAFGMILFSVQWSYDIISSMIPFYLFLAGSLITYLKYIYQTKLAAGPNEYVRPAGLALWSVPVCILILLLAFSIEASDKPIQWDWLDKKVFSVYNYFKNNLDYETFDYFSLSASSGFGNRNNFLGGKVKLDKTNVLYVTTNNRVYLKGASKDIYTGNSWINSVEELEPTGTDYSSMYKDYEEMVNGLKLLTENDAYIDEYFEVNPVTVSYLNIRTKSVFLPQKSNKFDPSGEAVSGFLSNTGDFSSSKRLSKGFSYSVNMYSPKIGSEEFAEVMRKSKKGLYSEYILFLELVNNFNSASSLKIDRINVVRDEPNVDDTNSFILDSELRVKVIDQEKLDYLQKLTKLKGNSEKIYDTYLQLPENLPQRVKDLSASLVASSDNNYDKAKAIEHYLASNFSYNLDVRSTPRNRDFIDYFLFDQKEGYCSYFASAMAILARCAGIPARYVEGYMLPPEPVKDKRNTFVVTNMQAHAWVEIYFEGYGWLPFEPTSPFRSNFYANDMPEALLSAEYNPYFDDYMEMMERYTNYYSGMSDNNEFTVQKKPSSLPIILISFTVVVLLFSLVILFNITKSRFRLYKLSSLPAKDCILQFYDYYEQILRLLDLGIQPSETPFQYCARIDSQMLFSPVKFKVITDIFVRARYSIEEASEKEKQLTTDFRPGFLNEIKSSMGRPKYFVYKYLLNKL